MQEEVDSADQQRHARHDRRAEHRAEREHQHPPTDTRRHPADSPLVLEGEEEVGHDSQQHQYEKHVVQRLADTHAMPVDRLERSVYAVDIDARKPLEGISGNEAKERSEDEPADPPMTLAVDEVEHRPTDQCKDPVPLAGRNLIPPHRLKYLYPGDIRAVAR